MTGRPGWAVWVGEGRRMLIAPRLLCGVCVLVAVGPLAGGARGQQVERYMLVSSRNDHTVKRYRADTGAFDGNLVEPRAGGLDTPQELLLDRRGALLVSGRGNQAILRFDVWSGAPLGPFTSGYALDNPTKASWGPDGHLYVSQWGERRSSVAVFDGETGAFLREATPDMNQPMEHAWDAAGTLYVVSFGSKDVRRFDADGKLIDVFVADPHLQGPVNQWFDDAGDLVVLDWQSGTIQRYSGEDGAHVAELASGLSNPEGWAMGPDGSLYVGEWSAARVRRLDARTWRSLGTVATEGGLASPNGILFVERRR